MPVYTLFSKNSVKYRALDIALKNAGYFDYSINCIAGNSGVSAQPTSLEETLEGARNRALRAFESDVNSTGVGIECGIFTLSPERRFFNISAAVLYDGKQFYSGLSPAFLHPAVINSQLLDRAGDISVAYQLAGLTQSNDIGAHGGAISILSNQAMQRDQYCLLAVQMALYDNQFSVKG